MSLRKRLAGLVVVTSVSMLVAYAPAGAQVAYNFSGSVSGTTVRVNFTVDTFLIGTGSVFPSDFDGCTPLPSSECNRILFDDDDVGGADRLDFEVVFFGNEFFPSFPFYFADGAFSSLGTHQTASGNPGTLTVRQLDSAVPEPTSWAMMLTGFGAAGVALRRRRRTELSVRRAT